MLIQPFSRFFMRGELRFRAARERGEALAFLADGETLDVQDIMAKAIKSGNAELSVQGSDVVRLTTMEVRPRDKLAVLLFRRSDPAAATPIFEHGRTRKLRKSDKKKEEGVAVSAHLFVHLTEIAGRGHPAYRTILEEVPGISRSYVQALLHDIVSDRSYEFTDHRGDKKQTYTLATLDGLKSEKVSGALKDSVVPYVTLVRPGNVKGMDTGGLVEAREERMKLVIKAKPKDTLEVLKKIQSFARRNEWSNMLVQVDMPEKRSRIVSIAREADAADILFVRSEQVQVASALDTATETINEELVTKAKEMFAKDGKT